MSRIIWSEPDDWGGPTRNLPGPTEAQLAYIATLCREVGVDVYEFDPATVQEASEMIDELKEIAGWT